MGLLLRDHFLSALYTHPGSRENISCSTGRDKGFSTRHGFYSFIPILLVPQHVSDPHESNSV